MTDKDVSDVERVETKQADNDVMGTDPLAWLEKESSNETSEEQAQDKVVLTLESQFTIREADELYAQFADWMNSVKEIEIEASAVDKTDAAALQFIAACHNRSKDQGINMHWSSSSETLRQAAGLLGLSNAIGF